MRFIIRSGTTPKQGAYFHEGPHSGTYWDPAAGSLAQPTPYESRAAAEAAMPRALATSLPDCETRPADARVVRLLSHAEAKAKAVREALKERDNTCTVHGSVAHGGEAEELRAGIERLVGDDPSIDVPARDLLALLDDVDARDSFVWVECVGDLRDALKALLDDEETLAQSHLLDEARRALEAVS